MELEAAITALRRSEMCLYPTETFFALGCNAADASAVAKLLELKQRPLTQGLPVIIGSLEQLSLACELTPSAAFPETLRALALELMERFWPGALSLVLPAAPGLAPGVARQGSVALRLTPHPAAARLCREADMALVASSANLRGEPPQTWAKNLNNQLQHAAGALLDAPPPPAGGLPSTLAEPFLDAAGRPSVRVHREGAVPPASLEAAGCPVFKGCGCGV